MRALAAPSLLLALLAAAASAGAAALDTQALVTLVEPATAELDHWTATELPAFRLTGTPDATVQLRLELRTADGRRLVLDRPERHDLDAQGRLLASPAAPPRSPHAVVDVVTLVICRE